MADEFATIKIKVDSSELSTASSKIKDLGTQGKKTGDEVTAASDKMSGSLGRFKTQVIGAAAAYVSLSAAIGGGRAVIQAAQQYERFNNALKVGLGDTKSAADALLFLRKQSEELGLNLPTVAEQFSKLAAAAKGTTLEGQASRDIFLGIAKASTALGLSAEQTGGALTAIQQIISKGNVSAEELRGQLGEASRRVSNCSKGYQCNNART